MEMSKESSSINLCKLCNELEAKYTCPRCNILYCSLKCYQSELHLQCSESFYKECVLSDIAEGNLDKDSQRKMLEILQRVQNIDNTFEDDELSLDSDDDSDTDLAERLKDVDLNDADSVWKYLSSSEKQEFQEMVRTGDICKVIPQWEPWWCYRQENKLVEEIVPDDNNKDDIHQKCPSVKLDVTPFSTLTKLTPSPCVRCNLINILAAYIVVSRYFIGKHHDEPIESTSTMLMLSKNLASNQNFEAVDLATESVIQESINNPSFIGKVESLELKEDLTKVLAGPSEKEHNFYVLAALNDLHKLFNSSKQCLSGLGKNTKSEFSQKYPEASLPPTPKAKLTSCIKKIEYLISWTKEHY
uniref:HIT-type domain-containing protein n=1 Tax=Clastoptera arizonana TaxID=38151 RepID=A0A1B6D5B0_9HEMI